MRSNERNIVRLGPNCFCVANNVFLLFKSITNTTTIYLGIAILGITLTFGQQQSFSQPEHHPTAEK